MNERSSTVDWLIFLALGLMWGSSYLFIKIAVDDFGTFTVVALRLGVGAALLWTVLRVSGQSLPRTPRLYGHLLVMAVINITVPFFLITWAERSVDSALAAILTSVVPLFAVVIAPLYIHDEPMRVNGLVGLVVGFVGVIVLVGRGGFDTSGSSLAGDIALLGASVSYAAGAVYSRRNVRGVPPMIPAVFQVTFSFLISSAFALALEHPWDARPGAAGIGAILWLGFLGSGFAYLAFFRLLGRWGATRTTAVAYVLPIVGIVLGAIVLHEPIDARILGGTALIIAGLALVNGRVGRTVIFARKPAPIGGSQ
ncbi:MAG TPA: EamA family transporter [Candidatus Limnocylindria bacterium]|nr:EamA family transporter [Candidatus Limnocylindria bacterium]